MSNIENDKKAEMPREKLERIGIEALTDRELLMLLIGSGYAHCSAEEIARDLLNLLDKYPTPALDAIKLIPGLGSAKASLLVAALELGRRRASKKGRVITTPKDIYKEVHHYSSRDQEHLIVVMLNGAHEVIGTFIATIGLLNRTLVHPREIYAPAINNRAAAICIAHNHPTGYSEPSQDDKDVTKRIKKAGEILGIKCLDHVVFSENDYYSFLEHGLI